MHYFKSHFFFYFTPCILICNAHFLTTPEDRIHTRNYEKITNTITQSLANYMYASSHAVTTTESLLHITPDESLSPVGDPPEGGYHECCFEEDPVFYTIRVLDFETKKEMVRKLSTRRRISTAEMPYGRLWLPPAANSQKILSLDCRQKMVSLFDGCLSEYLLTTFNY